MSNQTSEEKWREEFLKRYPTIISAYSEIMELKAARKLDVERIEDLEAAVKDIAEALGFYGNKNNCANPESCFIYETEEDGTEIADEGYTARQCLEKHKELIEQIRQRQQGGRG